MKKLTYVLLIAASFVTTSVSAMEIMGTIKIEGNVLQQTELEGKRVNSSEKHPNSIAEQNIGSIGGNKIEIIKAQNIRNIIDINHVGAIQNISDITTY